MISDKIIENIIKGYNEVGGAEMYDFSDFGNFIGLSIGKISPDDKEDLVSGLLHGLSIMDSTHDEVQSDSRKEERRQKNL